jgi:short-subunit dehydrogenase
LHHFNIKVKVIEPGGIRTNFINHGSALATHSTSERLLATDEIALYKEVQAVNRLYRILKL